MVRNLIIISTWVVGSACVGKAQVGDTPDAGDMTPPVTDMTVVPDLPDEPDEGPLLDPLCVGKTCAQNAVCGRGLCWCAPGFMGDADVGCTPGNPCAEADCVFGSTCGDDGICSCDIGFEENMGRCEPALNDFPLDRTVDEVCARWATDYPETAGVKWQVEPTEQCDGGELDPVYQLDAVRRVSLYRWLAGLQAVTTTSDWAKLAQACATTLDAHGMGATNTIEPTFACYTADAAEGALNSSVLRGATSPASSVDTFVEDADSTLLGNRRWILSPGMGATAFGARGDYTCMYATDPNGASDPQYVAYPLGVFPSAALRGRWMWASSKLFVSDATTVTVLDSGGTAVPVTNVTPMAGASFPPALSWEVGALPPGEYTVTLQGIMGAMNELTYPVNLVTCP